MYHMLRSQMKDDSKFNVLNASFSGTESKEVPISDATSRGRTELPRHFSLNQYTLSKLPPLV
jgi:hypothetical protein